MSTYIKHNGEWKRTTGVTVGQGDNTIVLSPGAWNDEYKPTITLEGGQYKRDPSAQSCFQLGCGRGDRLGYANFAWGSSVRRKKARIFYRCYKLLNGYFVYHYDGNTIDIWSKPATAAGTYYSGYFDVDDLSKLESIEIRVSDGTVTPSSMEIYVIELI